MWVANAIAPECLLVAEGGAVVDRVTTSQTAFACMLGGADRRTLYVMTAPTSNEAVVSATRAGRIEQVRVAGARGRAALSGISGGRVERLAEAPDPLADALLVLDEGEAHVFVATRDRSPHPVRSPRPTPGRGTSRTRANPSPCRARGSAPRRTWCPGAG